MSATHAIARAPASPFGELLKDWRQRRRLSQLDLGLAAEVSARHISFLETGRAQPSRVMIARLSDVLDAPLAARNALLEAAGFAAAYPREALNAAALAPVRAALERIMENHAPYPAILFSRRWDVLDANPAGATLLGGASTGGNAIELLAGSAELRARLINWPEVAAGLIARLRSDSRRNGGDADLDALAALLERAGGTAGAAHPPHVPAGPFLPVRVRAESGELAFLTATVELNAAQELTVDDLHLELYFPADAATAEAFEGEGANA